jgi:hypothetical protein
VFAKGGAFDVGFGLAFDLEFAFVCASMQKSLTSFGSKEKAES